GTRQEDGANDRLRRGGARRGCLVARRVLEPFLRGETPRVDRGTLAALQDDLAETRAGVHRERAPGDVADLEHLTVRHPRTHEARSDVDHQAEPGEARAPLEPAADVARER